MSSQTLTRLLSYIDRETSRLETSQNESPRDEAVLTLTSEEVPQARPRVYNDKNFLTSLQLHRLSITMDEARSILIDLEEEERHDAKGGSHGPFGSTLEAPREIKRATSPAGGAHSRLAPARKQLKRLNDRIQEIEHSVEKRRRAETSAFREEAKSREQARRRDSVTSGPVESTLTHRRQASITAASDGSTSPQTTVDSTAKTKSKSDRGELSMEEKLGLQGSVQETLSNEILGFASTLKANAIKMGEKLAADNKFVESAGDALDRVVGGVERTSNQLNKYNKSGALGWKFYILAVLGIFLSLVFGMTIVWIFPK